MTARSSDIDPSALPDRAYSVVITSCGRFDLLRETLDSFLAHVDIAPAAVIVIEDSADPAVRAALEGVDAPLEIIVNPAQMGQMPSIDRAYGTVRTPYVFHCEDDWLFERGGFMAESFAVLDARPDVSMVGLRPRAELNPLVRETPVETIGEEGKDAVAFFAMDPAKHPEYFSYSFNPGLRRMADYAALGPYAPLGHEADVSFAFKKAGFRIANLEVPAVRHIGDGRHVDDPTQRKKARTFVQKLERSLLKRLKRIRRAFGAA